MDLLNAIRRGSFAIPYAQLLKVLKSAKTQSVTFEPLSYGVMPMRLLIPKRRLSARLDRPASRYGRLPRTR